MKEKAVKKQSFLNRKKAEWKEMRLWNADELCRVDWIVSILILTVLFFTCVHSDVKLTGNRSFLMYKHFTDFYQASYEQSGGYWANYLPSTFIAYAIWNLPLYLTGHAPEAILTNSFVNLMWYKLLPVIIYFITAQLIYHIGKEMGFGEKKSLLCKFAFLVFPMGVFSQFIFSQYDIFTVFFMVLGLYFFLKNKMWQFALAFGMASTFKYHAVLYFAALLLLKKKKIRNLIRIRKIFHRCSHGLTLNCYIEEFRCRSLDFSLTWSQVLIQGIRYNEGLVRCNIIWQFRFDIISKVGFCPDCCLCQCFVDFLINTWF